MTERIGPMLRLWGLQTDQLPKPDASPAELAPFLISLLQEAVPFIDAVAPKSGSPASAGAKPAAAAASVWKPKGRKTYRDSDAPVDLYERVIPVTRLQVTATRNEKAPGTAPRATKPETWVCRRSVHRDAAAAGTASWAEFRARLKDRHAESEDAFTPTVVGAREAMVWRSGCAGVEAALADEARGGQQQAWGDFTLKVEEMRHRIGRPLLKDRTFPVLQMTCAAVRPPRDEFLVVSVTLDPGFRGAPQAQLSRDKGTVIAAYVSVERIRRMDSAGGDEIEWLMATASDARGVLPQWLQVLAVPGQIAKDVPLFLGWMARERRGEAHPPAAELATEASTTRSSGAESRGEGGARVRGQNGQPHETSTAAAGAGPGEARTGMI
ncbi:uncharacterized protein E0L32_000667 [Thyridium curvatum]|uniref:DUF3074 domain-containing protein n=1 Tax=Thyridium curvatum TaxID=1093900 RepID=A0A507B335_9PEZI|nr:uncharacterized protein E0L32_000667 [Thyridium curvatum]TPX14273.1 hypothetical protein E0L32_000667 [Thyridium curvatum]